MKYLFLDTNIYLHFKSFEQIDWSKLIEGNDEYCIVIPEIVIREIDKIKDSGRGKVQKKAKNISSRFGEILLENNSPIFKVHLCNNPPDHQFDGVSFSKEVSDDWFILSVLNYSVAKEDKIVVAADNIILIKAKSNGLNYIKLADEFKVAEELSEDEKKIRNLTNELNEYKNRISKPMITFSDGSSILRIKRPIIRSVELEINQMLTIEKSENSSKVNSNENSNIGSSLAALDGNLLNSVLLKYSEVYLDELKTYYEDFEKYNRVKVQNEINQSYLFNMPLSIVNKGTAQTGNMDVFVNIPTGILLYDKSSKTNIRITKPIKPRLDGLGMSTAMSKMLSDINGNSMNNSLKCWDMSKTVNNNLRLKYSNLNYSMKVDAFDDLYVKSIECDNFNINWTIIDSTHTKPITGTLNVIFD